MPVYIVGSGTGFIFALILLGVLVEGLTYISYNFIAIAVLILPFFSLWLLTVMPVRKFLLSLLCQILTITVLSVISYFTFRLGALIYDRTEYEIIGRIIQVLAILFALSIPVCLCILLKYTFIREMENEDNYDIQPLTGVAAYVIYIVSIFFGLYFKEQFIYEKNCYITIALLLFIINLVLRSKLPAAIFLCFLSIFVLEVYLTRNDGMFQCLIKKNDYLGNNNRTLIHYIFHNCLKLNVIAAIFLPSSITGLLFSMANK